MLNPDAPIFVPREHGNAWTEIKHHSQSAWDHVDDAEMNEEDLAELEATEEWVNLMCDLEDAEKEHLIAYALEHAPAAAFVLEEEVLGSKPSVASSSSHKRGKGGRRSPQKGKQ